MTSSSDIFRRCVKLAKKILKPKAELELWSLLLFLSDFLIDQVQLSASSPPPSAISSRGEKERTNLKSVFLSSLTFRLRSLLSDPQNALTARSLWGRPQHRDRCCLVHIDLWSASATAFSTLCRWQFFSFTAAGNFFSPFFPQRCMTSMENNCRERERGIPLQFGRSTDSSQRQTATVKWVHENPQ